MTGVRIHRRLLQSRRDHVGALEKGLRAIEAFDASHPTLTLSDVARRAGLSRAAARRYLLTLTNCGYSSFDGKHFALTPRIIRLGYAYFSAISLPRVAQPVLEQVGLKTNEVASLATLDGQDVVFLARSAPRRIMSATIVVGSRLPASSSGTGRVLLSKLSNTEIAEMLRPRSARRALTARSKTQIPHILEEIELVRQRGYSINRDEVEIGLQSLSVPLFDGKGEIIAALSLSTQTHAMKPDELTKAFLPILRKASAEIKGKLKS